MTNILYLSMLSLLAVVVLPAGESYADTFEFLTYTPPRGWVKQTLPDGIAYQRTSGIGLITFYPSYPATGSVSDEFAKMWRAQVEPAVPGPAPQPQLQREGDYTVAAGNRQIDIQGRITTIALAAIVGRGRTIGVLTTTAGDDVLREVTAFLDSVTITPGTAAATAPGSGSVSAGEIEVDFDVPPGYISQRDGRTVVLTPRTVDENTPCAYASVRPELRMVCSTQMRAQPFLKCCPVGNSRAIAITPCEALRVRAGPTFGSVLTFNGSLEEATNTPRP